MVAWERRTQTTLFIVLAAILVAVVWTVFPSIELVTSDSVIKIDRITATALSLVLSAILAAAFGIEPDVSRAAQQLSLLGDNDSQNRRIMLWLRFGSISFLTVPFVLLLIEVVGTAKPLSAIQESLETWMPPTAMYLVALLYTSLFGLAITLLTVDFFLQPLTEDRARRASQLLSTDRLRSEVARLSIGFLNGLEEKIDDNLPVLRGSPGIWTSINKTIEAFDFARTGAELLPMEADQRQKILQLLEDWRENAESLKSFVRFLALVHPNNPSGGKRVFKSAYKEDPAEAVADFKRSVLEVHAILEMKMVEQITFVEACARLTSGLQKLKVAGEAYYSK